MPCSATTACLAAATLLLACAPALAASRIPGGGGLPVLPNAQLQQQRQMMTVTRPKSPYAMTYSEQVAQSLGLRDGGVALYDVRDTARDPYTPSVSLGGTMIRLRWRQ